MGMKYAPLSLPIIMSDGETPPLFIRSSDKAVADGIGRSSKSYGLGRRLNDSFPIKRIAFRKPPANSDDPDSDAGPNGNSAGPMSSAQIRARQQQEEEFEAIKREARAAGLHACKLAQMGIVPGLIVDDGENVKFTSIAGNFGYSVTDAKKKRKNQQKKKKIGKKNTRYGNATDADTSTPCSNVAKTQYENRHGDAIGSEEKEEIRGEEEEAEQFSAPLNALSVETRTATTSPMEFDNATSASGGTKSSFFDPKRMFRHNQKKEKKANKLNTSDQTHEEALKEANDLIASGAWMCGVCGTPFDTSQNASSHEKICLIEWLKHGKHGRLLHCTTIVVVMPHNCMSNESSIPIALKSMLSCI